MGVYFFYGQEEYNIEQEIEQIKKKYLDEAFSSLNLRLYNSPDFDELTNIIVVNHIISIILDSLFAITLCLFGKNKYANSLYINSSKR